MMTFLTRVYKNLLISMVLLAPTVSYCETSNHDMHQAHMRMVENSKGYSISESTFELPNIELVKSDGKSTTLLKELATNDTIILNFIFTSCTTICPIMSGTFADVNKKLSDKSVKMISISIDPEYDTPKKLRSYAKKFNANEKWNFYTGNIDNIINVQKAFSDYRGNKMNHAPNTYIHSSKNSKWLRIEGFINSAKLVDIFNKNSI